ncbi:hypothetical protein HU200_038427 [Digitaria exilis]|uniref:Protein kinase domain-containing protein n=1 Tax=Digitaria exilis TaxID=1010633 RepID=A0A835BA91_9POAL|nr:hypothetical protein HU200_038427 [Digitaria exilis]
MSTAKVMGSKTKIYIVLEYATDGGVFETIHKKLLLDSNGNLKVSGFGLSALSQHIRHVSSLFYLVQEDGLLHTTCGTPNFVAPEVISESCSD